MNLGIFAMRFLVLKTEKIKRIGSAMAFLSGALIALIKKITNAISIVFGLITIGSMKK